MNSWSLMEEPHNLTVKQVLFNIVLLPQIIVKLLNHLFNWCSFLYFHHF
jgi:hypothetical protein